VGIVFGVGIGLALATPPSDAVHLVFAIVKGIVAGLVAWLVVWLVGELVVWLMIWLVPRLAGRFVSRFAVRFAEGEGSPLEPIESWRNDRVFGLVAGLAFGLALGLVVGLPVGVAGEFGVGFGQGSGLAFGLVAGLEKGLVYGLAVGLMYGITSSETWSTTLAWLQLQRSRRVPAVSLMPFLEDARNRGVLRTVGAVYQFRHATLQDRLAEQTTPIAATSPAAQHPS
jgi:hypothetical protein